MPLTRTCPDCEVRASANRAGKPGRCTSCIDGTFRKLGLNPLGPHIDSKSPRQYTCIDCGKPGEISYVEIRDKRPSEDISSCWWCICRNIFEGGLESDPLKWDITVEQAAQMILGDSFFARGEGGRVLSVADLAECMDYPWSLVWVECIVCHSMQNRSAVMTLSLAGRSKGDSCFGCLSQPMAEDQDQFFAHHGLVRDYPGYAKLGDKVRAHCADPDCGAERLVSFSELARGTTPCLSCIEAADPDAPHLVYIVRFAAMRAWKIGITNTEARHDRLASHLARGAELWELHEVPNKESARTVESYVLESVRDFPSVCDPRDFPQGGYTETWSFDGPEVHLNGLIENLVNAEAPGFDRIGELRKYFSQTPVSIEELSGFVSMQTEKVDGVDVHTLGLSEPEEQVLRKIRARRAT